MRSLICNRAIFSGYQINKTLIKIMEFNKKDNNQFQRIIRSQTQ